VNLSAVETLIGILIGFSCGLIGYMYLQGYRINPRFFGIGKIHKPPKGLIPLLTILGVMIFLCFLISFLK
jgi:hypothetical protein